MQPIGSLLSGSIRKSGIEAQVQASQVIDDFHQELVALFGQKILKKVQAKSLEHKILSVAVLSSVVVNEIRLNQARIIENINNKYKKTLVEKLRFLI